MSGLLDALLYLLGLSAKMVTLSEVHYAFSGAVHKNGPFYGNFHQYLQYFHKITLFYGSLAFCAAPLAKESAKTFASAVHFNHFSIRISVVHKNTISCTTGA